MVVAWGVGRASGPVSRVLSGMTIDLEPPLPTASNGLPGSPDGTGRTVERLAPPVLLYLAFLQVGFAVPVTSPPPRWALTPPFHPYLCPATNREAIGGLFSVALSLGSHPVGVTHHHALWSPDFPRSPRRNPAVTRPARTGILPRYSSATRRRLQPRQTMRREVFCTAKTSLRVRRSMQAEQYSPSSTARAMPRLSRTRS